MFKSVLFFVVLVGILVFVSIFEFNIPPWLLERGQLVLDRQISKEGRRVLERSVDLSQLACLNSMHTMNRLWWRTVVQLREYCSKIVRVEGVRCDSQITPYLSTGKFIANISVLVSLNWHWNCDQTVTETILRPCVQILENRRRTFDWWKF